MRCLQKEPAARYQSAAELASALRTREPTARLPIVSRDRTAQTRRLEVVEPRRRRWLWVSGAAFAALAAASLALYGFQMIRTLRARRRPALDWGIRYALTALGYLMLTALVGAALAAGVVRDEALAARLAFAYGFLGLGAWVSMMMMGMLYKIVPFLVWYLAYSDRVGLARVPDLGELCSVRLQRWGYWLFHLGTLGTAVGLAGGGPAFLRATTSLLAVAVLLFVLNMAGAFRHLARPVGLPVPSAGGGRA
jgi:hypothetical protein